MPYLSFIDTNFLIWNGRGLPLLLHGAGGLGDGGPVLRGGGALQQRHFIPLAAFPGIRVIAKDAFVEEVNAFATLGWDSTVS